MQTPTVRILSASLTTVVSLAALLGADLRAEAPPDSDTTNSPDATAADRADPSNSPPDRIVRTELAPRSPVPEKRVAELEGTIDRILETRVADEARVGLVAVDTRTGQTLYARNADETFNPASNMKLLTSAAALDRLGPSHTFETEILAGERDSNTVRGGLFLRGDGDAFLLFEDFVSWAAKLELRGIDRIEGGLVVDDTIFDGSYLPPGFGQKTEDASYRAPIGAVSVNFNAVTAIVRPGSESGEPPSVRTFPPNDHVKVVNRAETVDGRERNVVFKSEPTEDGATEVILEGTIGAAAEKMRSRLRIDHPPAYAGSIFREALSMVGVEFDGEVRTGAAPADAELLLSHRSQPLSYIVLAMNKWSNNFMAEQLLRRLGVDGEEPSTWRRSRKAVRSFAESVGIDPTEMTLKNGSGLYDGNRVAPRHLARLLTAMLDHRAAPEFVSSLAIAGIDGTLDRRMEEALVRGNLRGKTGTLNHVSALSGYVRTRSDRVVAFSMLFDETPRRGWHYRPVQDEIARTIAELDR